MKHSFTDEQLLNLVNNTILRKTEYQPSEFTGGSVQITSTHSNEIIKYKVVLFFGYSEARNSRSKQIDIHEQQVMIWSEALLLKAKSMQVKNNGMDYSELNSLMNNIDIKIEDREIIDNKIIDIDRPRTNIVRTSYEDVSEIVDYLNLKTNTSYKANSDKTRTLIKARMNEGFTVDDFKTVIDKKVLLWGKDINMQQYLRPITLFGTKFESYLNEIVSGAKVAVANGIMSAKSAKSLELEGWANE